MSSPSFPTPEDPQVSQDHQVPQIPRGPQVSQDLRVPQVPQDPQGSQYLEVPQVPPDPQASRDPQTSRDPQASRDPQTSQDPQTSRHPQTSQDPQTSRDPQASQDPQTSQDAQAEDGDNMPLGLALEIYEQYLREEMRKRPSQAYLMDVQHQIDASDRLNTVDNIIKIGKDLKPDTLYQSVYYMDLYLSSKEVTKSDMDVLGTTCLWIAIKIEEPGMSLKDFLESINNKFSKGEIFNVQEIVLRALDFDLMRPKLNFFLRKFVSDVSAAHAAGVDENRWLKSLTDYLAELSLLSYDIVSYRPSLVAASIIFFANFITRQYEKPWNDHLVHCTSYKPCELRDCVMHLRGLYLDPPKSTSKDKFKRGKHPSVVLLSCPTIPTDLFNNLNE